MEITIIKIKKSNFWTVSVDEIKGLVVQVEDLKDAPKELSISFELMVNNQIENKITKLINIKLK